MESIDILTIVLCALVFIQPTRQRIIIGAVFAFAGAAFTLLEFCLPNELYYFVPSIIAGLILSGICFKAKVSRFSDCMGIICCAVIGLNLFGEWLYGKSNDGFWYARSFEVLYLLAICLYLSKEKANDKLWRGWVGLPDFIGHRQHSVLHNEAEN